MKISYQWILAAIIVILVILVGAYVLTNNNNAPATNVTATPTTTITPTATVLASPSATPSTAATATPTATTKPTATATPTISGSNGVKLTEFGYYITYPPFSENQVNVNSGYVASPSQGDFVYFSPTSATITKDPELEGDEETPDAYAVVHRSGNLSGTTHVTISANSDGSIADWFFSNTDGSSSADVTFAPGESEKTIGIFVWIYSDEETYSGSDSDLGHLILTINDVDGVDSIGSNDMFTLTVNQQTVSPSPSGEGVQFSSNGGYAKNGTYFDHSSFDVSTIDYSKPWFEADITLTRTSTSGSISPNIVISETNIPNGDIYIKQQPTFADGQATATVQIAFDLNGGSEGTDPYAKLSISPSSMYTIGSNNPFYLDTFREW